jgi:hypothetical protein
MVSNVEKFGGEDELDVAKVAEAADSAQPQTNDLHSADTTLVIVLGDLGVEKETSQVASQNCDIVSERTQSPREGVVCGGEEEAKTVKERVKHIEGAAKTEINASPNVTIVNQSCGKNDNADANDSKATVNTGFEQRIETESPQEQEAAEVDNTVSASKNVVAFKNVVPNQSESDPNVESEEFENEAANSDQTEEVDQQMKQKCSDSDSTNQDEDRSDEDRSDEDRSNESELRLPSPRLQAPSPAVATEIENKTSSPERKGFFFLKRGKGSIAHSVVKEGRLKKPPTAFGCVLNPNDEVAMATLKKSPTSTKSLKVIKSFSPLKFQSSPLRRSPGKSSAQKFSPKARTAASAGAKAKCNGNGKKEGCENFTRHDKNTSSTPRQPGLPCLLQIEEGSSGRRTAKKERSPLTRASIQRKLKDKMNRVEAEMGGGFHSPVEEVDVYRYGDEKYEAEQSDGLYSPEKYSYERDHPQYLSLLKQRNKSGSARDGSLTRKKNRDFSYDRGGKLFSDHSASPARDQNLKQQVRDAVSRERALSYSRSLSPGRDCSASPGRERSVSLERERFSGSRNRGEGGEGKEKKETGSKENANKRGNKNPNVNANHNETARSRSRKGKAVNDTQDATRKRKLPAGDSVKSSGKRSPEKKSVVGKKSSEKARQLRSPEKSSSQKQGSKKRTACEENKRNPFQLQKSGATNSTNNCTSKANENKTVGDSAAAKSAATKKVSDVCAAENKKRVVDSAGAKKVKDVSPVVRNEEQRAAAVEEETEEKSVEYTQAPGEAYGKHFSGAETNIMNPSSSKPAVGQSVGKSVGQSGLIEPKQDSDILTKPHDSDAKKMEYYEKICLQLVVQKLLGSGNSEVRRRMKFKYLKFRYYDMWMMEFKYLKLY